MKNEREEAKQFSDNLDRLLHNEETGAEQGEGVREALEFARKIKSVRPEPSPQFKSQLKQKLLTKIAQQEAPVRAERSWFGRIIRQPVWQTVTAVLVIAIVTGVMWGAGMFRSPEKTGISSPGNIAMNALPTTTPATTTTAVPVPSILAVPPITSETVPAVTGVRSLQVSGSVNKTEFTVGETVNITITLKNTSSQPIEIFQFPPTLSIIQEQTMQPVYTFKVGQPKTLAANGTTSYTWQWDQEDINSNPVPPGEYHIELEELDRQGQTVQLTLSRPVNFEIMSSK